MQVKEVNSIAEVSMTTKQFTVVAGMEEVEPVSAT